MIFNADDSTVVLVFYSFFTRFGFELFCSHAVYIWNVWPIFNCVIYQIYAGDTIEYAFTLHRIPQICFAYPHNTQHTIDSFDALFGPHYRERVCYIAIHTDIIDHKHTSIQHTHTVELQISINTQLQTNSQSLYDPSTLLLSSKCSTLWAELDYY